VCKALTKAGGEATYMSAGVLATVAVRDPACCPVTSLSEGGRVQSVSQGQPTDGTIPVEVTTDGPVTQDEDADRVFSYDDETVYRLEREANRGCACERIETHGCPVRDIRAEGGELILQFIANDIGTLRGVIKTLRNRASSVSIRCLRHSDDEDGTEPVFVDKGAFTERQREVLRTAHEMGYFERPKRANAGDVAAELDIAPSTFAEHLAAAQTKLMDAVFGDTTARS
jgi:predicted DNA binding protein